MINKIAAAVILAIGMTAGTPETIYEVRPEITLPEPVRMRVTCYTAPAGAITASGQQVREGACAAKREWIGKTAVLYDMEMHLIGIYEITDTGGHPRITSGQSIDLYKPSLKACYEHIAEHGDYGYVQILPDTEG